MPAAPAELRGLTISGKPTRAANACASSRSAAPVDWAVGMPASRSASFIAGLSRQSQAVRTDVPGIVQASRTFATGRMCASTVASSRSTHSRLWQRRTASNIAPSSTTERTCS